MRPQKVEDTDFIVAAMTVIRDNGYEGASLNDLAKAIGLKKASLYHRFPMGKKEIAQAVLEFVDKWFDANITDVIDDKTKSPQQRLITALENIKEIYEDGNRACIMKAVSMNPGLELFSDELNTSMNKWISAFRKLAIAFGFDEETSENMASQVLIGIQGSLIVSKGLKSNDYFLNTLNNIEKMYLNK